MSGSNSGGLLDVNDLLRQALTNLSQLGGTPAVQMPVVQQQPGGDYGPPTSLLGRIGEAIGGSASGYVPMTSQQRDAQGYRNLMDFFGGMAARPFGGPGVGIAEGVGRAEQAAQQPLVQTEALSKLANEQQNTQLARVKAATDLLNSQIQLQLLGNRLGMPPLYGSNTGGPGGGPGGGTADGTDIYSLPKDQFLQAVAQRESGGNPSILNYVARADPTAYARGATASGKYQMVNSTWLAAAKAAGIDTTKYPTAMSAPESVQDQVASKLYDMQGTAPWNPAKFGANWVLGNDGKYQLVQGAPYTPPPGQVAQQPPATPAQPAGKPPAPGGGGETAALPLPPREPPGAVPTVTTPAEAVATAKAAGTPIQIPGTQALWATPEGGSTSTPRLIMPGTDVASASPTVPAAPGPQPPPGVVPPAPQPPAQQPPAQPAQPATPARDIMARNQDGSFVVPDDKVSVPEFQQRNRYIYSPQELAQLGVTVPANSTAIQTAYANIQSAERDANAARQIAQTIYSTGGDPSKAAQAVTAADAKANEARQAYTTLLQDADEKNGERLSKLYDAQNTALAADYKAKVTDPANKKAELAQQGQQQIDLEKVKQGLTFANTMEENDAKAAQTQYLDPMAQQAMKAHQVNLGLAQLQSVLPQLPKGGGSVGMLLDQHPDWAPGLAAFGAITSRQADAVQLINGIVSSMSAEMKPTGLGAMREYEFNSFKSQLPKMLETTEGQQKALAYLMNLNNRIQDESSWMQNYYRRQVPDQRSQTPGATRKAYNLDSEGSQSIWQKMEGDLGPVVPRYTPPKGQQYSGSGQNAWINSLPPGKPYYLTHSDGSTTVEVRPWQ